MKKKIAIIADIENWAFSIVANHIKRCIGDAFQVDIIYSHIEKYNNDLFTILEDVKNYDIVHFLWRKTLLQFDGEEFKEKIIKKGYHYQEYIDIWNGKITTAVYDHIFLDDEGIKKCTNLLNKHVIHYYTSSKKLFHTYSNIREYNSPWGVIMDATDLELFVPKNIERFEYNNIQNRPLILGWVGNSEWNSIDSKGIDYKGYHTIFKKVVEELVQEGYNIKMHCADRNENWIPRNKMPDYYKEIDIYVCVSLMEGTPNPVLESMATGVPIISTDVGVVKDVLGKKQQNYIINKRSIKEVKEKIIYLYNNRDILLELSKENLELSKQHHYLERRQIILKFFNDVINK